MSDRGFAVAEFDLNGSVDGFGDLVGGLHGLDGALVGDYEGEFFHYFLIAEGLDPVGAGLGEDYVDEKADIVGESAGGKIYRGWLRGNEKGRAVRREDADLGLVHALAAPVIDDGELDQRDGQFLDHDILEDTH